MNRYREELAGLKAQLGERFWRDDAIETLMQDLSDGLDRVITELFELHLRQIPGVALFAVGGYGRAEMHPQSDIDLLVVAEKPHKIKSQLEAFVRSVYDLNMDVGHSVRDPKRCRIEAKNDITVATALFERRFITGDARIRAKLDKQMAHRRLWPAQTFFEAKYQEQRQRHRDYDNVEYNLEPNIKTSPGGLRDIHTAMWICERKFATSDLGELVALGVITQVEQRWLEEGRRFLWWVRFGLHLLAERKEDRLQFDFQRELAQRLGFVDTDAQRGVERFMHHYYRHVLALTEVNDILVQYFLETNGATRRAQIEPLDDCFRIHNHYIEICHDQVFRQQPSALLEMFVIMAHRNDIAGVRASTIRAVRENLDLIDDAFRNNPDHTQLFLRLLKAPYTVVSQLTRMRRYGVLGRYIPEFGRVIGQMQHDLFHIYTVDAHTMAVIRNMRRFRYRSGAEAFPVAYHAVHTIPKIELLYIAGLYHDIGKGRGGDHSDLGAQDARAFCMRHGLSAADTDLVCWLVERHLYMSAVAQREDIYDPDVIHEFSQAVKSEMRLDYLYALTVADINATNPTLWNSWKATLLRHLYIETRKVLRRGLESAIDRNDSIIACQERALERLQAGDAESAQSITALWEDLGDDFFLRHTPPQVASLTEALTCHALDEGPFVLIRDTEGDLPGEGATQVYLYCKDQPGLFAAAVLALGKFQLSVVDALVATSVRGICFDCFTVLDQSGQPLSGDRRLRERIAAELRNAIVLGTERLEPNRRLLSRRLRQLPRPTETHIEPTADGCASVLTLTASDRPGLLANIALLFLEFKLEVLSAKVATLGERVEDTFVIQTTAGQAVAPGQETYHLENALRQRLDQTLGVRNAV